MEDKNNSSGAILDITDEEVRGETIYFAIVDRFNIGNQASLGRNAALDDPTHTNWNRYWGGDLQGIIDKLDYLAELGVTALWVTPLFEQVEGDAGGSSPMHGYWTQDFKRLNVRWVNHKHEVSLFSSHTVFDVLIEELHKRKMKFVLDIVCNHSSPATSVGKGKLYDDGKLIADFDNDTNGWYHHYGDIKDYNNEWELQNCELCGLATFNENNIEYRRYIIGAIKMWLDKGVDALRIDTVKHMPTWFWQEFNSEIHRHKPDVFIFGEWIHNHPTLQPSVDFANNAGMSVFDFGLCQAIRSCFGENAPQGFELVQEIYDMDHVYRSATELITMYENHDMPRLQSIGASDEMLDLATCLLMTGRGVPSLFYGCEQYLHNDTDGGGDPYNRPMMEKWDTTTNVFKIIQSLAPQRGKNKAIQWGGLWKKIVEKDLYVFVRKYHDFRCLVILNKGQERTIENLDTELPNGTHKCLLTGELLETKDGMGTVTIGEAQARVYGFLGKPISGKSTARVQVNGVVTNPGDSLAIIGDCPELGNWDVTKCVRLEYVNPNLWFSEVAFHESAGKSVSYKYVLLHPGKDVAPQRENRTTRTRAVPEKGVTKWRDSWEGRSNPY